MTSRQSSGAREIGTFKNLLSKVGVTSVGLPKGWVPTRLQEISEIILGQSPPSSTYNEDEMGLPFYQGKLEFGNVFPTPRKWCTVPKKIAEKNDVLISVRAPVGPTNICPDRSVIGRGLAAIRGLGGIESRFILYMLRANEGKIAGQGTGSTFTAISGNQLKQFATPLPPLPEQRRIVAKIEELFSDLDAGVEALKKIKAELKRYKQAVLKAAVEGKLTEEWRENNKDKLEPASVLLERIRAERAKNGKAKKLPPIDTSELPRLPEGWEWARIGDLVSEPQYGTARKCSYEQKGVPVLRIPNVVDGKIEHSDLKYALFSLEEVRQFKLSAGDILIIRSNGSLSLVGRAAVASDRDNGYLFAGYLIRLRAMPNGVIPEFLKLVLGSPFLRSQIEQKAKSTSGVNNINAKELGQLIMPVCSNTEQYQIVSEVERRLSVADELEKTVEAGLKQAERLRQSILKRAFEGKLVPQDPSDEPAEKLLERIKATRALSASEQKKLNRARPKNG